LVRVLKDVKNGFDVNRVEKSLISSLNPVNDVTEVFHGLAIGFEERQLGQLCVEVVEE
jgi:hypothetical protein